MGWLSADIPMSELKDRVMTGVDIVKKSGNWVIYRTPTPPSSVAMVVMLTHKRGRESSIKVLGVDEGPGRIPPESLFRTWERLTATDYQVNTYEQAWRDECNTAYQRARSIGKLTDGARIRMSEPVSFSDGVTEQEFVLSGPPRRRLATRRSDGVTVRLPVGFSQHVETLA